MFTLPSVINNKARFVGIIVVGGIRAEIGMGLDLISVEEVETNVDVNTEEYEENGVDNEVEVRVDVDIEIQSVGPGVDLVKAMGSEAEGVVVGKVQVYAVDIVVLNLCPQPIRDEQEILE